MKFLLKILCVAWLALVGATPSQAQDIELKFNNNRKFKIVQFTDIHWKYGKPASDEAGERMAEILDIEKPDLVVFKGDLVFSKPER